MAISIPGKLVARVTGAWRAARFRWGGAGEFKRWSADAEPCCRRMADFGRQTDEEFSQLARSLGALNDQFSAMRAQVHELDDILQDRGQTHALAQARALCKNSIELVHASLGIAHSVQEQMKRVDEALLHTCTMREEFDKSFLMLRTLAMGFRVEAARLDSEFQGVFANVAAAITDIDRRIAASTQEAFSRVEILVQEAGTERDRVNQNEAGSFMGANDTIGSVRADLEGLRQALAPCAAACAEIDTMLGGTGPRVMAVLGALQYQDIVRQRLEHVSEGFEDIRKAVVTRGRSVRHDLAYVGKAANIQLGQLHSARVEIERGGKQVVEGMEGLLDLGRSVLERTNELETVASRVLTGTRLAEMFGREISQLAKIAEASEQASRRVSDLVERIGNVVSVFSDDIAKQEGEVKLIALNAQVAAARLASAGALEKLAEETTRISNRNGQVSRDLASGLRDTLGRLTTIKAETSEFLSVVAIEKAVIERGAIDISAELRKHADTVCALSSNIRSQFSAMQADMRTTLDGVNFPAVIASCFDPAETLCHRLTAAAGVREDGSELHDARIDAHAARYTMEREREAHVAATHAADAPGATPAAVVAPAPTASPAQPGTDIELF